MCNIHLFIYLFGRRKRRDGVTAPGIRLLLNNLILYGFLFLYIIFVCSISL